MYSLYPNPIINRRSVFTYRIQ